MVNIKNEIAILILLASTSSLLIRFAIVYAAIVHAIVYAVIVYAAIVYAIVYAVSNSMETWKSHLLSVIFFCFYFQTIEDNNIKVHEQ